MDLDSILATADSSILSPTSGIETPNFSIVSFSSEIRSPYGYSSRVSFSPLAFSYVSVLVFRLISLIGYLSAQVENKKAAFAPFIIGG